VVNADAYRIPRANVMSPRTVAEVSDRHRQHHLCIGVHNSKCGCPLRYAPLHPHEAYRLYDGGVVYDGPRPRRQSSETTFDSVNGSRALTTGAARPSDINLYVRDERTNGQTDRDTHGLGVPTTSTTIGAVTPCRRRCDSTAVSRHKR